MAEPLPTASDILPPEIAGFLRELAGALRKWSMYPRGHEVREEALQRLLDSADEALGSRDAPLTVIFPGRHALRVGEREVSADSPLLRTLSDLGHEQQIAALRFEPGVDATELETTLELLGGSGTSEPLGTVPPEELPDLRHVDIEPLSYDPLRLGEEEERTAARPTLPSMAAATEVLFSAGAEAFARELELRLRHGGAASVPDLLLELARQAAGAEGAEAERLRRSLSAVVLQMDAGHLEDLLAVGRESGREDDLLRAAADTLEAEAVIRLVRAAAASREGGFADWLLRLLSKLSLYGSDADPDGPEATAQREEIRETVDRLLENWELEDPRPAPYASTLDEISRDAQRDAREPTRRLEVEPERLVAMGLEMEDDPPSVRESTGELIDSGRFGALASMLDRTPEDNRVGGMLWSQLSVPSVVRRLLDPDRAPESATPDDEGGRPERSPGATEGGARDRPDEPGREGAGIPAGRGNGREERLLRQIVLRNGPEVAPSLLDALCEPRARESTFRGRVIDLLSEIGQTVAPLVPARLTDERAFVRRNMLLLLLALPTLPDGFTPAPYLKDGDPAVRTEAFRIARDRGVDRTTALRAALNDSELHLVNMGLEAAVEACPPEAVPDVARLARDTDLPDASRVLAVRTLGGVDSAVALETLVGLVWVRKWFFWRRIGPPDPVRLEGIGALATGWADRPAAREVLRAAADAGDARIRAAASTGGEPPAS